MTFQLLVVFSFALIETISFTQARFNPRCGVRIVCTQQEDQVWTTTNGQTCEVFRNGCFFMGENCNRFRANKTEAVKISKERCQEICSQQVCLADYDPVCGIYNGTQKTFGNSCEMDKYICTTGETYKLDQQGACGMGTTYAQT